jgi:DNA-binding NarL/FixJ family response regulator
LDPGGINVESGRAVRILIVDDNKSFRDQLALLLKTQAEFVVVGMASDGEEAVSKAEQLQPDVVLIDQQMPKLTGIEATHRIKSNLPSTRVIFIAAEGHWHTEAMRAGAERFFLKDENFSELLITDIFEHLNLHRSGRWSLGDSSVV